MTALRLEIPRFSKRHRRASATSSRWRRFVAHGIDLAPPTGRGLAVGLLASLALGRWGYGNLDLLIFVFGLSGLVLLILACVVTVTVAALLSRRRADGEFRRERLETGSPLDTGFTLPAFSRVPLAKIDWRWVEPVGVDVRPRLRRDAEGRPRLIEDVVASRRGEVTEIEREIAVSDAFGLTRVVWRRRERRPLTILPHIGRLNALDRVRSFASAEGISHPSGAPEGDRMEIRPYVPGDSPRHILWKVYARTRQLEVRVPERAIDRAQRTAAFLVAGPGDEAAAAVARTALERRLLGPSWIFAADGALDPVEDLEPAVLAIARSGAHAARVDAPGADGLSRFLDHPEVRAETHCVIFAPAHHGPWIDELLAVSRRFQGTTTFVLATDGVRDATQRPLWHRVLFAEEAVGDGSRGGAEPEAATSAEELRRLLDHFAAAHRPCIVVDRSTGRRHGRLDPYLGGAGGAMAGVPATRRRAG